VSFITQLVLFQLDMNSSVKEIASSVSLPKHQRAISTVIPSSDPTGSPKVETPTSAATVFLKVHLYSTLEVRQTSTLHVPLHIACRDIFHHVCNKKRFDPKDYLLKMADAKTDVPLDKTLEMLKLTEFCIVKRPRRGSGGNFLPFFCGTGCKILIFLFICIAGDMLLGAKELSHSHEFQKLAPLPSLGTETTFKVGYS
jgi:hypothetical protein